MQPVAEFFQVGYVCRNLHQAMSSLAGHHSPSFLVIDVTEALGVADAPIRRIGLAYLDRLNIEVLEVSTELESIFREHLPPDLGLAFHHVGYLITDAAQWQELERSVEASGGAAMKGEVPGNMRFLYLDRRSEVGHYIEYVYLHDAGRALFANVPRNQLRATKTV
jgi:hypothetical protein